MAGGEVCRRLGNFNLICFLAAFCSSLLMFLLLMAVEVGDGSETGKQAESPGAAAFLQEKKHTVYISQSDQC